MCSLSVCFDESKPVWDAFVAASPQRSIFVYSKFLDSLMADYELVTCYDQGQIVAGTVVIREGSGRAADAPYPFTQYQGVLLADASGLAAHSRISRELKITEYLLGQLALRYPQFGLCQSWRLQDLRSFQWHNYHEPNRGQFEIALRYTGILELNRYLGFDDYLSSVRPVRRQEFKKASRLLELEESEDEVLLDALHAKTFARQNITRASDESELVKSICRHAISGGYGKMSCAKLNGTPVSAVLFAYDDRTAYYLFGANDPDHRNTGSGTFLMMHMIRDAFQRKMMEIDFVGVNSPNRGDFKLSFNAELRPYFLTSIRTA